MSRKVKPMEVIARFTSYFQGRSSDLSRWYIGVSRDPRDSLFRVHGVREYGDAWVFEDMETEKHARFIRDYFLHFGADGNAKIRVAGSKGVYAYLKKKHTRP